MVRAQAKSPEASVVLEQLLEHQRTHQLSIIELGERLTGPGRDESGLRTSDVSADNNVAPTAASLEADLAHYKELFSKLRFSYLEQVTKEKFIRAIVGEPPLVVEHQENVELEASLAVTKAELKAQKTEVAELVAELEKRGRELCRKHENIKLQTTQLQELPERIKGLEASIQELKASQEPGPNPSLSLPLEKTLELVEDRERHRAELDRQLEQLELMLPRKTRELERLQAELQPLEVKRLGSTSSAKEAKGESRRHWEESVTIWKKEEGGGEELKVG